MVRVLPTNNVKDTSNKQTENNVVSDVANITETGIDILPLTTPQQLPNTTSIKLVSLTNYNPPTIQPPKIITRNDTADNDTTKNVTITFDTTKVIIMNDAKINQSLKSLQNKNVAINLSKI